MIERKPVSLRHAFAEAVAARVPKGEVMRRLGIAEATYYKWKGRLVRDGDSWVSGNQNTRAKRVEGATAEATHEAICELSLEFPTLASRILAAWCAVVTTPTLVISASTIHSVLKKYGLSTQGQRAAMLRKRLLAGATLAPVQSRLVEKFYPMVRWKSAKGGRAGEILTQDIINLHHSSPWGVAAISIIVDTFDGAAFARFHATPGEGNLAVDCAREAIEEHIGMARKVRSMYTDTGHEFGKKHPGHVYNKLLTKYKVVHRLIDQQGTRRNPFVQAVWTDLREFLFRGGVANPASYRGRLHELNPVIREFLDKRFGHLPPQAV